MTIDEATIYDVVIVGGGITGLLTAYMLRDQNVLLLERTGRLGGKVKTITIGNIQLCGDYTHRVSYLAGAAYSSLRAARALGSKHVVPGDKEVVLPDPPDGVASGSPRSRLPSQVSLPP